MQLFDLVLFAKKKKEQDRWPFFSNLELRSHGRNWRARGRRKPSGARRCCKTGPSLRCGCRSGRDCGRPAGVAGVTGQPSVVDNDPVKARLGPYRQPPSSLVLVAPIRMYPNKDGAHYHPPPELRTFFFVSAPIELGRDHFPFPNRFGKKKQTNRRIIEFHSSPAAAK